MPEMKYDLKQIRGLMKLSQEEMAKNLAITREHYSRLENDSSMLRKSKIDVVLKISLMSGVCLNNINFFY
jgi:transcriptional regulator with XRE-family HTH domain